MVRKTDTVQNNNRSIDLSKKSIFSDNFRTARLFFPCIYFGLFSIALSLLGTRILVKTALDGYKELMISLCHIFGMSGDYIKKLATNCQK